MCKISTIKVKKCNIKISVHNRKNIKLYPYKEHLVTK